MTPQPLYVTGDANPAYHLRYVWTGWPSKGNFTTCPSELLCTLEDGFRKDGLRLLEHRWTSDLVQLILSTSPTVSPAMLAQRVKGRLDHALRQANLSLPFSRKLAVKSLGEDRRDDVESYLRKQVSRERFVDSGCAQQLKSYTVVNSQVDLVAPTASARGRYWYNLHVVLVTSGRYSISDVAQLCLLRDTCDKIAAEKDYLISTLSFKPDHLHLVIRGNIEHSPLEIGRSFQNNLAHSVGNYRLWEDGFYVGSLGEENMDATGKHLQKNLSRYPDARDRAVCREAGRDG